MRYKNLNKMTGCNRSGTITLLMPKYNITPDHVTGLNPNEIFVFDSNLAGRHGAGAAKAALRFGARWGVGIGLKGKTYALPTKGLAMETLSLRQISGHVSDFGMFAEKHDELTFLVTEIGCGLAGYTPEDIAPMFAACATLPNVFLPARFWDIILKQAEK